tara:strand:+ start:146 stop:475 length:330 start_codon:yes stop_codon:yes gene_type:complete
MKIESIVGDVVLLVLQEVESLKEMGIQKNKIYARIAGYDENGIWIEHPNFQIPRMDDPNNKDSKVAMETVTATVLIAWPFITSIVHFPNVEGFDFPNPFDFQVGFDIES